MVAATRHVAAAIGVRLKRRRKSPLVGIKVVMVLLGLRQETGKPHLFAQMRFLLASGQGTG